MSDTLVVNEVYLSLQGESTFAGLPCIFVRLTACDLRCSYCDTAYAFTEGKKWRVSEVLRHDRELAGPVSAEPSGAHGSGNEAPSPFVRALAEACAAAPRLPLVELTGGEPLPHADPFPLLEH